MINCDSLTQAARKLSLVASCEPITPELLRITTIFKYPDGSHVDLFLREHYGLLREYTLSDLGETTGYLLELNIRPWKTNKRKELVSRICKTLGIRQDGAELKLQMAEHEIADQLGDAIVRLSQACIRVSDLALSFTVRTLSAFRDDVEEFLDSNGYKYETDVPIQGGFGKEVKIDFQVEGPRRPSLIQTLAAANAVTGSRIADDVFTKWYDIKHVRSAQNFLTVYDSESQGLSPTDLQRIEDFAVVVGYPDQQSELIEAIAA